MPIQLRVQLGSRVLALLGHALRHEYSLRHMPRLNLILKLRRPAS